MFVDEATRRKYFWMNKQNFEDRVIRNKAWVSKNNYCSTVAVTEL
jgi:hypothetical protein